MSDRTASGYDLVFSEFFASLRSAGFALSPSESIDALRAASIVGLAERDDLRAALRLSLVKKTEQLPVFERVFDAFFSGAAMSGASLRDLRTHERAALDHALESLPALRHVAGAFLREGGPGGGGGGALRLFAEASLQVDLARMESAMQVGVFSSRLADAASISQASTELPRLRAALREELGDDGDLLARELAAAIEALRRDARAFVQSEFRRRRSERLSVFRKHALDARAFASLDAAETESILHEVGRMATRIRGTFALRRKRHRAGALDVRRTLRRAHSTGGIPFVPFRKRVRRDKPKLVVLCDVSDSVRSVARFLLLLVHAIQTVFRKTRSFVFVSDIGDATDVFANAPIEEAIALVYGGAVAPVAANSDYGHAFSEFVAHHLDVVDRHTTVLIIGDARNNFRDAHAGALDLIARRARRVFWLNPEARGAWGFGDSAMPAYLPHVTRAFSVSHLASLREAVDALF